MMNYKEKTPMLNAWKTATQKEKNLYANMYTNIEGKPYGLYNSFCLQYQKAKGGCYAGYTKWKTAGYKPVKGAKGYTVVYPIKDKNGTTFKEYSIFSEYDIEKLNSDMNTKTTKTKPNSKISTKIKNPKKILSKQQFKDYEDYLRKMSE